MSEINQFVPEEMAGSETNPLPPEVEKIEINPEIKADILNKVQDIDSYGVAFSSLTFHSEGGLERLKSALTLGLIETGRSEEIDIATRAKVWKDEVRNPKKNVIGNLVYFNIVGRMNIFGRHQIKACFMLKYGFGIIFNLDKYEEKYPGALTRATDGTRPSNAYAQVEPENKKLYKLKKYFRLDRARAANGFCVPDRISPRLFEGIVWDQEVFGYQYKDNRSSGVVLEDVVNSMLEINQNYPERLVPIYNTNGDLLWPEQMSYEGVRQYVKAKKAENLV